MTLVSQRQNQAGKGNHRQRDEPRPPWAKARNQGQSKYSAAHIVGGGPVLVVLGINTKEPSETAKHGHQEIRPTPHWHRPRRIAEAAISLRVCQKIAKWQQL